MTDLIAEFPKPTAELIGLVGVALYFSAFTLLQTRRVKGGGFAYTMLNLAAASCVLVSLTSRFSMPTLLIQCFWITVSTLTLVRLWQLSKARLGDDRDRFWAEKVLPDMPIDEAVALLSLGRRENTREGLVLLHQGAAVRAMYLLTEGAAEVLVNGAVVQRLEPGALVGEFGVMTSAPATATVRLVGEGSLYRFDAKALQQRTTGDDVLASIVDKTIRAAARLKLDRMNLGNALSEAPALVRVRQLAS